MTASVQDFLFAAKQHEIDELRQLAAKTELVIVIGHLVHSLQKERGASSIYLASAGRRFGNIRADIVLENGPLEEEVRSLLDKQLESHTPAAARLYTQMAWVLIGLDSLKTVHEQIAGLAMEADDAIRAYIQIIAYLISLIFEIVDTAISPDISRSLAALFHFIQGKEQAGQERALGALCFASGRCDDAARQRLQHLVEQQEYSFPAFTELTSPSALGSWRVIVESDNSARLEYFRRILHDAQAGASLDPGRSDAWFDCSSVRLTAMRTLERMLPESQEELCGLQIA
ncbi:MAG: nitrate- and nitrite sensing domain-containing protein [Candidatus Protistobacter heckmanni]|nr:nitrate- and nitrite sensing domain-containing protein [Candidatus Protistobacter heckmanni]